MNELTIAIFEDNPDALKIYEELAEKAGFTTVSVSENFMHGYSLYGPDAENPPSPRVALLDAQMPWYQEFEDLDELDRQTDIVEKWIKKPSGGHYKAGDAIAKILRNRFGEDVFIIGNSGIYDIEGSDISTRKDLLLTESILNGIAEEVAETEEATE